MKTPDMNDTRLRAVPALLAGFAGRPRSLSEAVKAAVEAAGDDSLTPPGDGGEDPKARARALLALLVECYVRQIYNSKNVAARAARDPDFPWLWWEEFPDADTLRRFRSDNHAAIHGCLAEVLRFVAEQKLFSGELTRISPPQLAEEASRRITMAAFADTTETERL
jgi:hypothetical protein